MPLFMNMSINPVLQILGDDILVSKLWLCPFPLFMTPSPHSNKFVIVFHRKNLFSQCHENLESYNVFLIHKLNHQTHLTLGGISD